MIEIITMTPEELRAHAREQRGKKRETGAPRISLPVSSMAGENLSENDFFLGIFRGVDFTKANLSSSEFGYADITGAVFHRAKMIKIQLVEAFARGAEFNGADMTDAILCGTNMQGALFIGTSLQGADFAKAFAAGANFYGANLTGINIDRTDFEGAYVGSAIMLGAKEKPKGSRGTPILTIDDLIHEMTYKDVGFYPAWDDISKNANVIELKRSNESGREVVAESHVRCALSLLNTPALPQHAGEEQEADPLIPSHSQRERLKTAVDLVMRSYTPQAPEKAPARLGG